MSKSLCRKKTMGSK